MKLLIGRTSAVIGLSLLAFIANAKQSVDESMAADPKGTVEIEHLSGAAKIIGWNKNEVSVKGELGEYTEEFKFERDGSSIIIYVKPKSTKRGSNSWGSEQSDDLVIHVPMKNRINYTSTDVQLEIKGIHGGVNVDVVNGEVDVDDLIGRIRLESVNANIKARRLDGDVAIETVNGNIEGKHSGKKELKLSTVNGDIDIESDSPEVSAKTVNGHIELNLKLVSEVIVNTVNGAIEVAMDLKENGQVEATSVGGSIDLVFQKSVAARFDIEAYAGGTIKNTITEKAQSKAKYGPRRWLEFSTSNPTGTVDISTVHGRVKVSTK